MPRVSVVIPCYNLGEYLDEAVDSVLAQTFTDYEIIIVNDGSTDPSTCELLAEYSKPNSRVIHIENQGVAAARNRGIEVATGKYILPLDADDRVAPDYLDRAVKVLSSETDVGVVYCKAELFGEMSGEWGMPDFSLPHQLLDNLIFSAAIFRRDDWVRVGGYKESMYYGWEDWDFWNRVLRLGREVVCLPEVLFHYRIRRGSRERSLSLGRKAGLMIGLLIDHWRLYLRYSANIVNILLRGARRRPAVIRVK